MLVDWFKSTGWLGWHTLDSFGGARERERGWTWYHESQQQVLMANISGNANNLFEYKLSDMIKMD